MSFGFGVTDFLTVIQLAQKTFQNAKRACGAHDELTRELMSLHTVLGRLDEEARNPASLLQQGSGHQKEELNTIVLACEKVLKVLGSILEKYNALSEDTRSVTKLWQKVKFGNGEMQDVKEIRLQLSNYTSTITLYLNVVSLGSHGRVEQLMNSQGGVLVDIRESLNLIAASMTMGNREGSVLTSYADDDKAFWKNLRRELIAEGVPSSAIAKHREIIKSYVMELGSRGVLDDSGNEVFSEAFESEDRARVGQHDFLLDQKNGSGKWDQVIPSCRLNITKNSTYRPPVIRQVEEITGGHEENGGPGPQTQESRDRARKLNQAEPQQVLQTMGNFASKGAISEANKCRTDAIPVDQGSNQQANDPNEQGSDNVKATANASTLAKGLKNLDLGAMELVVNQQKLAEQIFPAAYEPSSKVFDSTVDESSSFESSGDEIATTGPSRSKRIIRVIYEKKKPKSKQATGKDARGTKRDVATVEGPIRL
jgi:hypothetical protein